MAQHHRQTAEQELLYSKQKATEVAGKLELTGGLPTSMHVSEHCSSCAYIPKAVSQQRLLHYLTPEYGDRAFTLHDKLHFICHTI